MNYRGRFAPSPTGPLHFGSLIAAVASYCDAKSVGGKWLLRIDDIDPLREMPGATSSILHTLAQHGLYWDEEVLYQSTRKDAYHAALEQLQKQDLLFYCTCSRQRLAPFGNRYPGLCRNCKTQPGEAFAIRIKVEDKLICLDDLIQGHYCQNLMEEGGDFILLRKEGFFSYHLACMLDEAYWGITHVVRGADLLESTPKQIYLAQQLNLITPIYAHIPVILSHDGVKLSKQTGAQAIAENQANQSLIKALRCLGQTVPNELFQAPVESVLQFAVTNWSLASIPRCLSLPMP